MSERMTALFSPRLSFSLSVYEAGLFASTSDLLSVAAGATTGVSEEQTKHRRR